jgi:ketosteroid isomerase-like protein
MRAWMRMLLSWGRSSKEAVVTPLESVQRIYEAFGRGDAAFIVDLMSDDVQWEAWADNSAQKAGVPWLRSGHGKAGVAAFFQLAGQFQIHDFKVLSIMGNDRQVAAEVVIDATPPGAQRYRDEEIHLWTFGDDGKVTRLRHYTDTAKHIAAAGLGLAFGGTLAR